MIWIGAKPETTGLRGKNVAGLINNTIPKVINDNRVQSNLRIHTVRCNTTPPTVFIPTPLTLGVVI